MNIFFQQHNRVIKFTASSSIIRAKAYAEADEAYDHQLLMAGVYLQIRLKRPKREAQTFLIDAELKKIADRTNIAYPDAIDPNITWEDIKTEITCACESVIKEREPVSEKKQPPLTIEQCR